MTQRHWRLTDLDVIGYGDSLATDDLPRRVTALYRVRARPERVLFPPFRFDGDDLVEASARSDVDLDALVASGDASRLEPPVPAQPDYHLWIDADGRHHYEHGDRVVERLRSLAKDSARKAQAAFAAGDLTAAGKSAQVAVNADPSCLNGFLIRALVHRRRGDERRVARIAKAIAALHPGIEFDSWLELYAPRLPSTGRNPDRVASTSSKLHGLALERSDVRAA